MRSQHGACLLLNRAGGCGAAPWCGVLHPNRVAADDNPTVLMSLAVKPLAMPPFPLDRLERAAE